MAEPSLSRYRLIRYHRRGYGGSLHAPAGVQNVAQHTADALSLLHHLGVSRAHIVGHSLGAAVALQLALYARRVVHSLSLLEPPLGSAPGADEAAALLRPILERYQRGEKAEALDDFCRMSGGDYRKAVAATLGKAALDQAAADVNTVFASDLPAGLEWQFERDQARHITAPVLLVVGDETIPYFQSSHDSLAQWFAAPQQTVIFRTTHLLQIANPGGVADGIARFLARYPMPKPEAVPVPAVARPA
jgi:3-oxoadipate enol-lactonase